MQKGESKPEKLKKNFAYIFFCPYMLNFTHQWNKWISFLHLQWLQLYLTIRLNSRIINQHLELTLGVCQPALEYVNWLDSLPRSW